MTAAPSRRRIEGFDGLRAVSAFLVFVEHKVRDLGTGAIGVWIFFVISGYLIVGILHRSRDELEAGETTRSRAMLDFWRNRALRILPVYYVVVIAVFVLTHALDRRAFAYYAVYLQNFYIACVNPQWGPTTHLWSLALEQQFYVAAAPLLILTSSRSHRRVLSVLFLGCLAVSLLATPLGYNSVAYSLLPPPSFAFMALGGIAFLSGPSSRLKRLLTHPAALQLSGLLLLVAFIATRFNYDPMAGTPLIVYASAICFSGTLVCWVAENPSSWLVRALEAPFLRWAGNISYGFYVYHAFMPGPGRLLRLLGAAPSGVVSAAWVGLQLAAALGLAHVSWRYFERRFLALKHASVTPVAELPSRGGR